MLIAKLWRFISLIALRKASKRKNLLWNKKKFWRSHQQTINFNASFHSSASKWWVDSDDVDEKDDDDVDDDEDNYSSWRRPRRQQRLSHQLRPWWSRRQRRRWKRWRRCRFWRRLQLVRAFSEALANLFRQTLDLIIWKGLTTAALQHCLTIATKASLQVTKCHFTRNEAEAKSLNIRGRLEKDSTGRRAKNLPLVRGWVPPVKRGPPDNTVRLVWQVFKVRCQTVFRFFATNTCQNNMGDVVFTSHSASRQLNEYFTTDFQTAGDGFWTIQRSTYLSLTNLIWEHWWEWRTEKVTHQF